MLGSCCSANTRWQPCSALGVPAGIRACVAALHVEEKVIVSRTRPPVGDLLSRIPTGISGFDELSRGGLPRNRTSLVMGGSRLGKDAVCSSVPRQRGTPAQGARHLRRLRGTPTPGHRECVVIRLGPERTRQGQALFPGRPPVAGNGPIGGIRPGRPARHPEEKKGGDRRGMDRVRRHRRAADAAGQSGG